MTNKRTITPLDANERVDPDYLGTGATGAGTKVLLDNQTWDVPGAASHPDLATHDALGLATDAELTTHVGAADPHTGYVREADANWVDLTDGGATALHSHAGGGGGSGTATLDFGAFPGSSDASVAVTSQAAIVSGSLVEARMRLVATATHTADEHWVEGIHLAAGNIVAGTGFTIYGRTTDKTRRYGTWTIAWNWA